MKIRYLFNTISGFATFYIVFALLFFGAKNVGQGALNLGDTLEGMFAGYVTWMLAMMGCTDLAWNVSNEIQTGTFEQQCLSPLGYKWIAVFNETFNFADNAIMVLALTLVMSATTGQRVHLQLSSVIPVMLSIYVQAVGLGFCLAGLALIYKRIQSFFQVVQFLIIGVFFIPWDTFPLAKYLPLAASQRLLQKVVIDGTKVWQASSRDLLLVLVVTVVYLAAGILCFSIAESKARTKGLLGQY